jgi:predicted ATP-grasp superfamily ATP-dependent carboligase
MSGERPVDGRAASARSVEEVARAVAGAARAPAVVVNVAWVNGLAAVRQLGRAGIPVVALDRSPSALGFRSRYAHPLLCPDPGAAEEAFADLLAALGEALGRPAPIFPTHDEELNAISRAEQRLAGAFPSPFPDARAVAAIQSKRRQLEAAAAAGVPAPRTRHPGSADEALAAGRELGFPVLVKPSDPVGFKRAFRRQAFRCATTAELERAYADAEPYAPMVQELIPGGDDELYTLGSYLDAGGRPLGIFCGRKLRQVPPGVGTCRVGEAVWVDAVVEHGLALLRELRFRGLSQVELKRDPRDGVFKLMEVNPRLWQWHGLAAACGVDLPLIAYRDLLGEPVEPVRSQGRRGRWAISVMSGDGLALPRPPYVDAVLALDDLRPAAVQLARVLRGARA